MVLHLLVYLVLAISTWHGKADRVAPFFKLENKLRDKMSSSKSPRRGYIQELMTSSRFFSLDHAIHPLVKNVKITFDDYSSN